MSDKAPELETVPLTAVCTPYEMVFMCCTRLYESCVCFYLITNIIVIRTVLDIFILLLISVTFCTFCARDMLYTTIGLEFRDGESLSAAIEHAI